MVHYQTTRAYSDAALVPEQLRDATVWGGCRIIDCYENADQLRIIGQWLISTRPSNQKMEEIQRRYAGDIP